MSAHIFALTRTIAFTARAGNIGAFLWLDHRDNFSIHVRLARTSESPPRFGSCFVATILSAAT
jgi:hypothetical protein